MYQALLRTCSHPVALTTEEQENAAEESPEERRQTITYKSYIPMWEALLDSSMVKVCKQKFPYGCYTSMLFTCKRKVKQNKKTFYMVVNINAFFTCNHRVKQNKEIYSFRDPGTYIFPLNFIGIL